jgi:DNA-binding transcriptional MerR regulator
MSQKEQQNQYGIGAVAKLTGLSTHVIRAWERRYGAVIAERSATGRRRYGFDQIQKLTLLKRLIEKGSSIGSIADMSVTQLGQRLDQEDRVCATHRDVRLACFGASVGRLMADGDESTRAVDVVVNTTDIERFRSGIRTESPDLLIVEITNLVDASIDFISELQSLGRAAAMLIVFAFGRRKLEQQLRERGIGLLRLPLTSQELAIAIDVLVGPLSPRDDDRQSPIRPLQMTRPPPRRFNDQAIDQIARLAPTIDCECPRHLADLVRMLSAFEAYSQSCEHRGPEDAALHGELFQLTAQARSIIEHALSRVLEVEQFSLEIE